MQISLKPAEGGKFVFSLLPEKVNVKYAANYQSFSIIRKGEVKVPKGQEVTEISWDGEFFGKAKKKSAGVNTKKWQSPDACVRTLKNWMNKGTELTLIISGTWINLDVTISSFTATPHGAYGDVSYSVTFAKVRDLKIYTVKESKAGSKKKAKTRAKKKSSSSSKNGTSYYIVRKGDTLYKIAAKKGCTWQKLYEKNKTVIEKAAKKHGKKSSDHGHWIWPGTKLTIP